MLQVQAYAVTAASKLLSRFGDEHRPALEAVVRDATSRVDADVQQRGNEVATILSLRGALPVRCPSAPLPR